MQWRIQTKLRPEGPKKIFWEIASPPPLSKGLDDRAPPLSQGLDPALKCIGINLQKCGQDECFDSAAPYFSTSGNISGTWYCPY